ncbi:MAG: glycoside hydrolase family 9 protein [Cyanobacteria bacterium P01_E01_bin.45]
MSRLYVICSPGDRLIDLTVDASSNHHCCYLASHGISLLRGQNRSYLKLLAATIAVLMASWAIATSRIAKPQSSLAAQVYPVSPSIVALEIEPPPVTYAQQTHYQPSAGDRTVTERRHNWLMRGQRAIGSLVGHQLDILYPFDSYTSPSLNTNWLDRPSSYRLSLAGAPQTSLAPTNVYRKTEPVDMARVNKHRHLHPQHHTLYLQLPSALDSDRSYTIHFVDGSQDIYAPINFQYQPDSQTSAAIHVSQIGFRPDDPIKVGFLSTWMGTGGGLSYSEGLPFTLIDHQTDEQIFNGTTTLRQLSGSAPANQPKALTDVYQLDFSSITRPGTYHLYVDTIGCSLPFDIGERTWLDAFYISARGFYHQRSGIALGPPYTDVTRPRPFHPDEGLQVFHSTTPLMDTKNGLNAKGTDTSNFENLLRGKTDDIVPNAWGGYFDAGDWDRRIQHLNVARGMLELLEQFPEPFTALNLDLPESANDLPDVLDEALWGIDFFKRMQTEDGGIRGGIESAGHPRRGEASWQESQTVMAYAPGPWSSYIYAGVAARAARLMQRYAPDLVEDYRQSAVRAMTYAEQVHQQGLDVLDAPRAVIETERSLAALEFYQLTADPSWHELSLAALAEAENNPARRYKGGRALQDLAFVYARLPVDSVDVVVQQRLQESIIRQADRVASYGSQTDYGWTKLDPGVKVGWNGGLGSPKATTILRAYSLTGNPEYLRSAVLACQFSAGANPDNMTFTTGLGIRSPQHPLVVDQRMMGESPPPGITVYGPIDPKGYGDYWMFDVFREQSTPPVRQWPAVETYFDVYRIPAVNEFTVMQSMLDAAYAWGYLGARN